MGLLPFLEEEGFACGGLSSLWWDWAMGCIYSMEVWGFPVTSTESQGYSALDVGSHTFVLLFYKGISTLPIKPILCSFARYPSWYIWVSVEPSPISNMGDGFPPKGIICYYTFF